MNELELETRISKILCSFGMYPLLLGFDYLKSAIIIAYHNPDTLRNMTSKIYTTIAKDFNSTPSRVERAIRHAIEIAYTKGDPYIIYDTIGYVQPTYKKKPTNGAFISLITNILILDSKKEKST